jgi:hypothetical protein
MILIIKLIYNQEIYFKKLIITLLMIFILILLFFNLFKLIILTYNIIAFNKITLFEH